MISLSRFVAQSVFHSPLSRTITSQIHPKAEKELLVGQTKLFAEELSKNRHTLDSVRRALQRMRNPERDTFDEIKNRPLYGFIKEIESNPYNRSVTAFAVNLVKIAESIWQDQKTMSADNAGTDTMERFGITERFNLNPGNREERGNFFCFEGDNTGRIKYQPVGDDNLCRFRTFLFDGFDQSGMQTTNRMVTPLLSIYGANLQAIAHHYATPPSVRGAEAAGILRDRNLHYPDQEETANRILETHNWTHHTDIGLTFINYSYGTIHAHGVTHAIHHMLMDPNGRYNRFFADRNKILSGIKMLNVGTQPFWSAGENWGKTRKSINIWAGDDLFGVHSHWSRVLLRETVNTGPYLTRKPCVAYFNPESENQVLLFLTPGVVDRSIVLNNNRIVNVGGHGFPHYLAAFGMIPSIPSRDKTMEKAGSVIKNFLQKNISETTLAEQFRQAGLPVLELNKDALKAKAAKESAEEKLAGDNKVMQAYAKLLADETLARGGTHPLVDAIDRMEIAANHSNKYI